MNSKNLKVIGAVVLSCLVMILIVIYTPKPEPRRSKRRLPSKVVDPEYLKLANQALSKTIKANRTALQKLRQFAREEKIDFSALTAANTAAIDALAKADNSIKLCNEELQKLKKEEPSPTILIEANIKLIASLNEISETVKTLNIKIQHLKEIEIQHLIQHLKEENAQPLPHLIQHLKEENAQPLPRSIEKVIDAITKVTDATQKGTKAIDETINAYREYYQLDRL